MLTQDNSFDFQVIVGLWFRLSPVTKIFQKLQFGIDHIKH